jgi:hypothetical protein
MQSSSTTQMKQPPESAPEIDGFIKIAPVRPIDAQPIDFFHLFDSAIS